MRPIGQARPGVDSVVVANKAGAKALAERLVQLGYRRYAVLAGPQHLQTALDRTEGFTQGLGTAGITPVAVVAGEFTRDGGYAAMADALGAHPGVDCVLAANDIMAVGAMALCRERGVAVPGDLGVAGFDDIPTLRDVSPDLTTIALPLERMGAAAIDLVLAEQRATPRRERVAGQLVVRESTPGR